MKSLLVSKERWMAAVIAIGAISIGCWLIPQIAGADGKTGKRPHADSAAANASQMLNDGRQIFRFDTFGDEAFWSGALQLDKAIEGAQFGGVGAGISPAMALSLGLKVDVEALPRMLIEQLKMGRVDLNNPAVTLKLLQLNAVVGVKGTFTNGMLQAVGLTCAVCHSTVNDSLAPGIGMRLDGVANHDLNPGAIIAAAPNITPITDVLRVAHPTITDDQVRSVLLSWGPGKFDAELLLDGKATRPDGGPAATLIPNAGGLAGHNLHTWTGGWGTVTYWNALVAVLELHGIGTFFDERFDDTNKFPIAATLRFGHVSVDNPDDDQVTSKLPALHFYQLALPTLKPTPGVDFDQAAADRGDELFSGKANCNRCHREPIWTEPGWNDHTPGEMKIDSFQADRSPDGKYRTMNLAGLFVRERGLFMKPENKGRFYHDGRFATLLDVVKSYNDRFSLGLTAQEESDLVEYLKSL
jgi:mono/diheme cytochrome c family protein